MLITVYTPEGKKTRTAVGYSGGLCHQATVPYEKREVPGSMQKTPTAEACEDTPTTKVAHEEKARA